MIYIELSIYPHAHHCEWDGVTLRPGSRPPHTIRKWEFKTWQEARVWHETMAFISDRDVIGRVLEGVDNEYVGHEIELLEVTGTEYTGACLSIEGNED